MIRNVTILKAMGIQPKTVIHVGSHHAQDQLQYERIGAQGIFWCEADPACVSIIKERYPNSRVIEGLFWSKVGMSLDFWVMQDRAQNSVFRPRITEAALARVRLSTTTLDVEFANIDLIKPIMLVLDVQGAEIEVLKGASNLISKVEFLVCEITDVSSKSFFSISQKSVESYLRNFGLVPILKRLSYNKEYFDLLFVRRNLFNQIKIIILDLTYQTVKYAKSLLVSSRV
jgi:FkbM family methyltransferase